MNFKRKGLLRLLNHCQTHAIKAVLIEFKDRLARFGGGVNPGTALLVWDRVSQGESGRIGLQARTH